MSAAVSTIQHTGPGGSAPGSRVGTSSPVDNKRVNVKNEESSPHPFNRDLPSKLNQSQTISTSGTPSATNKSPTISVEKPPEGSDKDVANSTSGQNSQSIGESNGGGPDYFSLPRPSRLDQEPNPFEQSFATNSHPGRTDPLATPKSLLPPVAAMTSPAPLGSGATYWGDAQGLRAGPLSPAMLQGPANGSSFGLESSITRTGLTPNESGIRSGLTPGGTGSIFSPSPSNALFSFSGGATPGTMEFQKTALSAATATRKPHVAPPPLMQPHLHDRKPDDSTQSVHDRPQPKPRQPSDPFGHDPAHNAANGLYLLANQIPEGYQQAAPIHGVPTSNPGGSLDSSPNLAKRAAVNSAAHSGHAPNHSISGSSVSNTVRGVSEISENMSDSSQEKETPARKRNAKSKAGTGSTGKRKNDEGPKSASKKSKAAPKSQASDDGMDDENEDELDENGDKKDTKKMTDEEKRRNFLERNRVAALKCRQRKKQWLANLQAKVEMYGTENDALNATVQQLREEIVSLKTLLLAHKDCPVARSNGVQLDIAGMASNEYGQMPVMPYGSMGMPMHHPHQAGPGQRRYS